MELRHIRYFLAVAREGNFTRAAARLGIGQPPLSLQIKDLEAEIGAKLFHRLPHGAELTEAGQAFQDAVRSIPDHAAGAVLAAQRAARGETGRLTLGVTGTAALNPIVSSIIRAFRRAYPAAELTLEESNSVALVANLLAGRLDVAILRPTNSDPAELQKHALIEETLVVAMPSTHPAAHRRGRLNLAMMKGAPLILTPRSAGASLHDAAVNACRSAGFEPTLGQPAPQIATILSLVSAELGISLVPASMRSFHINGVVFRDLNPAPPRVALAVAHRGERPPPLIQNFAMIARDISRLHRASEPA